MDKICDGNTYQNKNASTGFENIVKFGTAIPLTFFYLQISRSASGKIWIGVTDETSENTWTDTLGKPITFFKWSADEPNDKDGEDCVYTNEDDKAEWNDKDCNHDKVKHFACQYGK